MNYELIVLLNIPAINSYGFTYELNPFTISQLRANNLNPENLFIQLLCFKKTFIP